MITAIAALATLYVIANDYELAFLPLFLVTVTGLILSLLFPLCATRVYDAATTTSDETITLLGIEESEERICYLVQDNNSFDFLWYSTVDGVMLTSTPISNVSITYQDDAHYVFVKNTTNTYHNEWLFLNDSIVTKTDHEYHFFLPRDAVWYPYETN